LRVLLGYRCSREGRSSPYERLLPVGVGSLAAVLRRGGHEVCVANYSASSRAEIEGHLTGERPQVVGLSVFTFNRSASYDLVRTVRRKLPGATIVIGGPHASHLYSSILEEREEIDYVVIGEGEATLLQLVDGIAMGADTSALRGLAYRRNGVTACGGWPEPIEDLDALPLPFEAFRTHGVDPRRQFAVLVTSRGCPAKCAFCNTPEYWGSRIRFRSADHVLAELRALRAEYGLLEVSFRDDTFTADRDRVLELCGRMEGEKLAYLWDCQSRVTAVDEERLVAMRRAGCVHVQYGVESGSPRILARLAKGIKIGHVERAAEATRRAGLRFSVYLIAGVDGEEEEDLAATEALLSRIRPHGAVVSPLAVFPGTALWAEWKRNHGLTDAFWSESERESVFVREGDAASARAVARIGRRVNRDARQNEYGLSDLADQRRRIGDCHALDLAEADLLEAAGKPGEALGPLLRLKAREPWNPWAPLRLGKLHLAASRFGEAAARLREAVEAVPKHPEPHALLGDALSGLGRNDEAQASYREGLALAPAHAPARLGLRRLARRSVAKAGEERS
jgi:radical SAM superfamily enzyme YgiQ (UPF0313 family)